jgi:hypothetical protein
VLDILTDIFYLIGSVTRRSLRKFGIIDLEFTRGGFSAAEFVARVDFFASRLDGVVHAPGEKMASDGGADDGFFKDVAIMDSSHCRYKDKREKKTS